jgi:hypothetical protein
VKIYKLIYSTTDVLNHTNYLKIFSTFLIAAVLISLIGINSVYAQSSQSHNIHLGKIASINQGWILSGSWIADINKTDPTTSGGFYSLFNMVMTNGSAPHIHKIYNAIVNNVSQKGNDTIIDGSVSITMKDGPVDNVPITVIVGNKNTIAILLDPSITHNHFGNTPIYGLINNPKEGMAMIKMLISDPEMKKKWIPLIMGNIMQNIKTIKMNHKNSMMNDISNMSSNNPFMSMLMNHKNSMMNDNMSSNNPFMSMLMNHKNSMMNDNMVNNYPK